LPQNSKEKEGKIHFGSTELLPSLSPPPSFAHPAFEIQHFVNETNIEAGKLSVKEIKLRACFCNMPDIASSCVVFRLR
jgi:hypothetical protein